MAEQERLSPFPDHIALEGTKEEAIRFLLSLNLPGWIAAQHLARWAVLRNVSMTPDDYKRVRGGGAIRPGG